MKHKQQRGVSKTRSQTQPPSPFASQSGTPSTILYEFKIRYTLLQRTLDAEDAKIRVPDKVPVILEEVCEESKLPPLARRKLLLPRQMTAGQLIHLLRARLSVSPNNPLLVLMGERLVQVTDLVGHIYDKFHDVDGFLYVAYSPEDELSGPKRQKRVSPSPPPPPTTPISNGEGHMARPTVRKGRGTKEGKRKTGLNRAQSKHSVKSHKSISWDGSVKRQPSKKADDNEEEKKDRGSEKKVRDTRTSPQEMGMRPKSSRTKREGSVKPRRETGSKARASARSTKHSEV